MSTMYKRNRLRVWSCTLGLLLTISTALAKQPSSEVTHGRESISLNGVWKFKTDPVAGALVNGSGVIQPFQTVDPNRVTPGETAGFYTQNFEDGAWATMPVPSNWDLFDEYSEYFNNAWYRRTFTLPPQPGKNVKLHFGAVYYQAEVWLNGVKLGHHIGGATPFEFDISDYLKEDGVNTLAVRANNLFRQGAWWPWGGISRDVTVFIDSTVSVKQQVITATPNLNTGDAKVNVRATLVNTSDQAITIDASALVSDTNSQTIANLITDTPTVEIAANSNREVTFSATLSSDQYELWHFDHPNLYFSHIDIATNEGSVYHSQERFGIRDIDIRDGVFKLNGEPVRLLGYNRITDDRVNGSVEPIHSVRRDLDRMKAAGTNLTRMMHEVLAKEVLEYADEIGIMIIAEVPVWGVNADLSTNNTTAPRLLAEMIERDINHPAIIAWSIANEIKNTTNEARAFVSRMVNLAKELDPTRSVTYSRIGVGNLTANDALQYTDFPSVNVYSSKYGGEARKLRSFWPEKPVFISEFSSDGYSFGTDRETLEHTTVNGPRVDDWNTLPYVMGASIWAYNDYRSQFYGTSINQTRGWGIQDTWGNLKVAYDQMQKAYAPVSGLSVTPLETTGNQGQSILTLTPRDIATKSIPSFALKGYHLLWQALGRDNTVLAGQVMDLPDIQPGSEQLEWLVHWDKSNLTEAPILEKVTLLSPTGHEVAVDHFAVNFAQKPAIREIVAANGALRVAFDRVTGAERYEVTVTTSNQTVRASSVKAPYVDIDGLANGQTYTVKVYAVNRIGTVASIAQQATPSESAGDLPPQIQALTAIDRGYVLGFIRRDKNNTEWEVEVTDSNGAMVETYTTQTIGASRNDRLNANTTYNVRIRAVNGGEWSEYSQVTTLGEGYTPSLAVQGVLAGDSSLILRIAPHPQAIRYEVTANNLTHGETHQFTINSSAIDVLPLQGLKPNADYRLSVAVVTSSGRSEVKTLMAKTESPQFTPFTSSIELDTGSSNYQETQGQWLQSSLGGRYLSSGELGNAEWTFSVENSGIYQVDVFIPESSASPWQATYQVTHAQGQDTVPINQRRIGGQWYTLGSWEFDASQTGTLSVNATSRYLRADRIRLTQQIAGLPTELDASSTTIEFNTESAEYVEVTGNWRDSADAGRYSRSSTAIAGWDVSVPSMGQYEAQVFVESTTWSSEEAQFTVQHAQGEHTLTFDQESSSGKWVSLGSYEFLGQQSYALRVTNLDKQLLRAHQLRLIEVIAWPQPNSANVIYDLDANGVFNAVDIAALEQLVANDGFIDPIFDVNNDGVVNTADLEKLSNLTN